MISHVRSGMPLQNYENKTRTGIAKSTTEEQFFGGLTRTFNLLSSRARENMGLKEPARGFKPSKNEVFKRSLPKHNEFGTWWRDKCRDFVILACDPGHPLASRLRSESLEGLRFRSQVGHRYLGHFDSSNCSCMDDFALKSYQTWREHLWEIKFNDGLGDCIMPPALDGRLQRFDNAFVCEQNGFNEEHESSRLARLDVTYSSAWDLTKARLFAYT